MSRKSHTRASRKNPAREHKFDLASSRRNRLEAPYDVDRFDMSAFGLSYRRLREYSRELVSVRLESACRRKRWETELELVGVPGDLKSLIVIVIVIGLREHHWSGQQLQCTGGFRSEAD